MIICVVFIKEKKKEKLKEKVPVVAKQLSKQLGDGPYFAGQKVRHS